MRRFPLPLRGEDTKLDFQAVYISKGEMDEKLIDPKPEKLEVEQSNKMQRRISFGIEEKEKRRERK